MPSFERRSKFETALALGASAVLSVGQRVSLKSAVVNHVFHNKELKHKRETDPDSRLTVKISDLSRFTKFMKGAQQSASEIQHTPVLIVQGEQDRLIKPEASAKLFQELSTTDKQMIALSKSAHLVFEDGQFDAGVITQVQTWLTNHTDAPILSASIR